MLGTSSAAARNVHESYSTGRATLLEALDAQRTLLDVRRAIAEARIERERRLAELEQLGAFDVEALATTESPEPSDESSQDRSKHE